MKSDKSFNYGIVDLSVERFIKAELNNNKVVDCVEVLNVPLTVVNGVGEVFPLESVIIPL